MKKIVVQREEEITEVIDRLLMEPNAEIVLVIPNGSVLGRSVSNFHLLARDVHHSGKSVIIESVDDTILAFAKQSGLESSHPLWRGVRAGGGISDIIPADHDEERDEERENHTMRKRKKKVESVKLMVHAEEEPEATLEEGRKEEEPEQPEEEEGERWRRRFSRKIVLITAAALALAAVIFSVTTWVFGYAAVTIDFKKTPWEYQGAFLADKSISKADMAVNAIPAQVFTAKKNVTQLFPALGKANVSAKAQGVITIYNAYSSAAQELVATTRFVAPDGKIFRIVNGVIVPGAKITNGQIIPSSVDAQIVADQAGPDYNVGPVAKLAIPGLQGSPKYNGFYGKISGTTAGGFAGRKAAPTAADIASAKAKTTEILQASLKSNFTANYPNNFKILEGATNIGVTKLSVATTTDASGNFTVFGEAILQAIGFDEAKFKDFLLDRARTQKPKSAFDSLALNYSGVRADFANGTVKFSLSAQGTLAPAFSAEDFKKSIAGRSLGDARAAIAAIPDLSGGKISVWPMWLWKMPSSIYKVRVNVN